MHHLDYSRSPSAEAIEREARSKFGTVIPPGLTVTIFVGVRRPEVLIFMRGIYSQTGVEFALMLGSQRRAALKKLT